MLPHWGPGPQAWPLSVFPGRNLNYLSWTRLGTGTTAGYLSLPCLSSTTGACWWPGEQEGGWERAAKAAQCKSPGVDSMPVLAEDTELTPTQPSFWTPCLPKTPPSALLTTNSLPATRLNIYQSSMSILVLVSVIVPTSPPPPILS